MKEAIQSRLDKYNKDNNVTEDIKITNFKSSKSININNNINTQKNTDKKNENIDNKFSADKEVLLTPYYTDNEKNEKKNEDSTRKFPFFAQRSSTEGVPERAADSWPDGPAVSLGTQHTF